MTTQRSPESVASVTMLLERVRAGDSAAEAALFPLVYDELHAAAERILRHERVGITLQPTDLVHEGYLKLAGTSLAASDRRHFLAIAARAMRQVLVSHARRVAADKRGGGAVPVRITNADAGIDIDYAEVIALDDALARLGALNERLPKVIELRFFAGMSEEETAGVLGVTSRTIQRDWAMARAWLYKELYGERA